MSQVAVADRVPAGVPTGGQFAASARPESGVDLEPVSPEIASVDWSIESGTLAMADPARTAQVEQMLAVLDRLIADSDPRAGWMSGGGFTCDGGALATSLVASRLGIENTATVGLYWHHDPELRAEMMGDYQGDDSDEDWQAHLDDVQATMMDEHHHWVVLWPGTDHAAVWDPNAEVRDEPHLQDADEFTTKRYEEILHGEWRRPMWDPDEPLEPQADLYPGMAEAIDAAIEAAR